MNCDECMWLVYDDDDEEFYCTADMDEDDMARLHGERGAVCPFYKNGDEYAVVRHQM